MANILNIKERDLGGRRKVIDNNDTIINVDENGKIFLGVILLDKNTCLDDNVIRRSNDGQQTCTEAPPIFKTVPVRIFPERKTHTLEPAEIFRVADRYIRPGSFVKRNGRLGFVLNVRQTASARIISSGSKYYPEKALYVYNKPQGQFISTDQQSQYRTGAFFETQGWIGKLMKYERDVILKVFWTQEEFATRKTVAGAGKKCRVRNKCLMELSQCRCCCPCFDNDSLSNRSKVYPGLTLKLTWAAFTGIAPLWESPAPTPPMASTGIINLEVLRTEVTSVTMDWMKQIPGTSSPKPPKTSKKLKPDTLVCITQDEKLVLGNLMMSRMTKNDWDQVFTKAMWENTLAKRFYLHRRVCKRPYPRDHELSQAKTPREIAANVPVEVMETETEVDVEWLDGVVETLPALDLHKICSYQVNKTPVASLVRLRTERTNLEKYGVVQSVIFVRGDATEDHVVTMIVQWYQIANNPGEPPVPVGPLTEVVSVDLEFSPMHLYKGDVVMTNRERNDDNFVYGQVISTFTDGRVRVRGPNGKIFRMWPNHISVVRSETPELP